jgi:hypothetical protein
MQSARVGKLLTGMVLVAALTIALPGSTEAAGRGSAVQSGGDAWELVVSWLSDLWNGAVREPVNGTAGFSSIHDNDSSAGSPSGAATSATVCQGDQGVCIDPNG